MMYSLLVRRLGGSSTLLLFGDALGNEGIVLLFLFLLTDQSPAVESFEVTATLKTDRSNETLDFGTVETVGSFYSK